MKKTLTITTLALLAGGVSAFAQGQISMGDGPDAGGAFGIQVFGAQAGSTVPVVSPGGQTGLETMGFNGNAYGYNTDTSTTGVYAPGSALGAGYSVQLLMAEGSGAAVSALQAVGTPVNTWYTSLAGYWQTGQLVNFGNPGDTVTIAIAAWWNNNGTVNSLADAIAAGDPWGISNLASAVLGGGSVAPPALPVGLDSFSLVSVPEPSTIALGVIGASTLLFRRRK